MASSGRRVVLLGGVMSLAAGFLLAGCGTSSATRKELITARDQLGHIHAENLGHVVGHGSYGSTGVSGSRPTAFVAIRTDVPTDSLMATIVDRMQQAGFSPSVSCRPPLPCIWQRTVNNRLVTARAVAKTGGQPWGEKSTAHGKVAPGSRVVQVAMTVGG
jgi:hypothetical protein